MSTVSVIKGDCPQTCRVKTELNAYIAVLTQNNIETERRHKELVKMVTEQTHMLARMAQNTERMADTTTRMTQITKTNTVAGPPPSA
jgi:L-lactate utilization protein LutB